MNYSFNGFCCKIVPFLLLVACSFSKSMSQNIASWHGKVLLEKGKNITHPDGSIELGWDNEIELSMTLQKDRTWYVEYLLDATSGSFLGANKSTKPNTFSLDAESFGPSFHIDGEILPDSSKINCVVVENGKVKGKLTLLKYPDPKAWSAKTTVNGNEITLTLNYEKNKWGYDYNDQNGSYSFEVSNDGSGDEIYLMLNRFGASKNYDYLKGKISKDSSTIDANLYSQDSLKLHILFHLQDKQNIEQSSDDSPFSSTMAHPISLPKALLWFMAIWIGLILLIVGIVKLILANRSIINNPVETSELDQIKKLFPIIRINIKRSFFGKQKLLLLNDEGINIFYKSKRKDVLKNWDTKDFVKNIPNISSLKTIHWNEINKMTIERETGLGKVRFQIQHNHQKERFVLPHFEMENVIKACQLMLGDKLEFGQPIRLHNLGIWIKLLLASFIGIYLYSYLIPVTTNLFGIVYWILLIFLIFYTFIHFFGIYDWILDQIPRKSKQVIKKKVADLSHRKPFRSLLVAILIRIIGGSILLFSILIHYRGFLPKTWSEQLPAKEDGLTYLITGFGYLVAGLLLNLALAFANRNPKSIKYSNEEKPILYLRSFQDDRETTFQPGSWLSSWMGVDPPYYQMNKFRFISDTWWVKMNRKILKYFYNNHPVRLIRILFSWPVDTSEQQLELYFRKKGAFVAIGRPGEKIITSGANRMYVTNEEWQDVVLDYLNRSQLIVLQPNSTEGVWWEIGKSVELVEPERLFYCMMNFRNRQNDYENFRIRFEALQKDVALPKFIGNSNGIYFFRFNANWQVESVQLKYRKWYKWPFVGNAADLESTLIS